MKEYKYDNATIRITIPNEKQLENIRKATEIFLKKAIKEIDFNGNANKTRTVKKS